ncbi:arrestin domain-containing protein 17-like [Sitodiplosis mosellana]|uniref:arrestin domain-containing protein 17-like n=1 Tax=Sitodiplosis mosellana TaxID=263140 RepID=UPI0024441048|nr:arrestin domain-containing protein 17-like [Sitodiplosis mosellana]
MPTTCVVEFENNPEKVFYAGQLLCGTVQLTLTEKKNVRGIYIEIRGKAYAYWTREEDKKTVEYTGKETYLDKRIYFVGGKESDVCVSAGSYNYNFECMLPSNQPTSFEGETGYIRYTARVCLEIPLCNDIEFKVPFTVIRAINLNDDPTLKEPVLVEKYKKFNACFLLSSCSSDPLRIVARTPVGGYTPGQVINLEIDVKNKSDQDVSEFTVELIKQIVYYENKNSYETKYEEISIIKRDILGSDVNQEKMFRVNLEIPPIPPTDEDASNIVKVGYTIRITGKKIGRHKNLVLYLPIIIGTFPILDATPPYNGQSNGYPQTNNVISQQPSASLLPDKNNLSTVPYPGTTAPLASSEFPEDDRPTYEESIRNVNNQEGGDNFKPKYPMYRRQTSYSTGN